MPGRSVSALANPPSWRLTLWLGSLAALTTFNIGLWIWIAQSSSSRTPYLETQLLLSGVYVAVCGFRSLFPRVDLERQCLWDTWLSAVLLGRTLAMIAELCFALQCSMFVHRLAALTGISSLSVEAHLFVPLVVVAELCCWYGALSLNHIGHVIEGSLWALLMLVLSLALALAAPAAHGSLRLILMAGFLIYAAGAGLTALFDVRMYIRRWKLWPGGERLTLVKSQLCLVDTQLLGESLDGARQIWFDALDSLQAASDAYDTDTDHGRTQGSIIDLSGAAPATI